MKKSRFYSGMAGVLIVLSLIFLASPAVVSADDATDAQIALAVKGGQKYLLDTFISSSATTGYWNGGSYTAFPATCLAVAALIETGRYSDATDPNYAGYVAAIDKAITYIKSYVKGDGGIYVGSSWWGTTYENGLAIVALSLYGQVTTQNAAYQTMISNAMDYMINGQTTDGGWTYTSDPSGTGGDLSNTQFAVMGLYYGSKYLQRSIADKAWAVKLSSLLAARQNQDGGFAYSGNDSSYYNMTAGGLWCLAMIGQGTPSAGSAALKAINWFDTNFPAPGQMFFTNPANYWGYYGLYGAAKAFAASLGTGNLLGNRNWVTYLKNIVYANASPTPVANQSNSWNDSLSAPIETPMVLMSLAFGGTTETISRIVTPPAQTDIPAANQGSVTLKLPGGGPVFSNAAQGNINVGGVRPPSTVTLPIGSFDFTVKNVPIGGQVVVTIECPQGVLQPNNPHGFVNADGTIKAGLSWWKIQGGAWKGLPSVPIKAVPVGGPVYTAIEVTLTDGGPEDLDGVANGIIVDPGAPGFGSASGTTAAADTGSGSGFCFIATAAFGSYMAPDVLVLRQFRDKYLLTNALGRGFVDFYYHVSPPLAQFIAQHESLRFATRMALTPIVYGIKYPLGAAIFFLFGGLMIGMLIYRRKLRYV